MPKYTRAQRQAYYVGKGYRAGQEGKVIPYKNRKNLESFRSGYRAAKKAVDKYPKK